ncbi:glucose-6-phosphate isomerase [Larsenimonas rhizosphaerae]|uniref:Glucose-6-phosphate isomerase n=1 Tax=Larsenimonas rhizosphaerae TaxID=2944682 RepID=A0AA41ZMQ9_9GAMM|nr:glucose-6-phosphate isomerase [Larsenimonas rhizosphaerae]MCM2132110.1 glucose-6-phosphate isomerase [Larsenimonas rhizosphaerae]MCX2524713.1 glucose-6-phosphate isomerase [Larsenimonas rhizosphaerae]
MSIRETRAWQALETHYHQEMKDVHLRELINEEGRFDIFAQRAAGIMLDMSKQRMRPSTLDGLMALAEERNMSGAIEQLFSGGQVNVTEGRPALHTALRLPESSELHVNEQDVVSDVHATLGRMEVLVSRVHAGQWRGATGKPITDVINLGVGGSDLGPLMVSQSLDAFAPDDVHHVNVHFASTIDGSQLADLLPDVNPETTLFILSSKSFGTIDTLSNAETAMEWLKFWLKGCSEGFIKHQHFIGVSTKPEKMSEWGIHADNQLLFWDWVGGRYSLWSGIGLPIALHIGMDNFRRLLAGAHEMDEHFRTAPLKENLPVLFGLAGIWNVNFLNIRSLAVLPYDGRLKHMPGYFQQLEMESNGKSVTSDNQPVDYSTCPVIWGEIGPNGQHAFYQLLHQGTQPVACDFIVPIERYDYIEDEGLRRDLKAQHRLSLSNCFAQSRVLMLGDDAVEGGNADAPPYKRYRGNQPSSTLLIEQLTPETLGALIALYEHKVFVQGTIWDVDSFDQWGVELGKEIANATEEIIRTGKGVESLDTSSRHLIETVWQQTREH